MYQRVLASCIMGMMVFCQPAGAYEVPSKYPSDYQKIIEAATKEGQVIIYSTTDTKLVEPLLKDFEAIYPGIRVDYQDLNSADIIRRFTTERSEGRVGADIVWTSAMDSGLNLGVAYAVEYASPEAKMIPEWANYHNKVYGTTFEPIVAVYNKKLVPTHLIPKSNQHLGELVLKNGAPFANKITTYDIEKSAVGFMLAAQDNLQDPKYFEFIKNVGTSNLATQSSIGAMLDRVASGESLIAYNVFASYAETKAAKDARVGILYSNDYTLIMSRVTFISTLATHPNAAKLWLDYTLSERGQNIIANKSGLGSIRADVPGDNDVEGISKKIPGRLAPIPINDYIITFLGTYKRLAFIKQWRKAAGKI